MHFTSKFIFSLIADGVKIFSQFLQSEYSEENICFWLACENLKSLKSNKIGKTAQKIYKTFIEIFSVCEVSLHDQTHLTQYLTQYLTQISLHSLLCPSSYLTSVDQWPDLR